MKRRMLLKLASLFGLVPTLARADATQAVPAGGAVKVIVKVPMVLTVKQGNNETLVLSGSEEQLKRLRTGLTDGVLSIDLVDRVLHDDSWKKERLSGVLTVKTLNAIQLDGAGTINMGPFKTDDLHISVGGAASIVLDHLQARSLDMSISGSAQVKGSGTAESLALEVSGVGVVGLEALACNSAKVSVSGSASVTVSPKDQLDAEVSGVGQILYHGNPHVHQQVSGIGRVSPA